MLYGNVMNAKLRIVSEWVIINMAVNTKLDICVSRYMYKWMCSVQQMQPTMCVSVGKFASDY